MLSMEVDVPAAWEALDTRSLQGLLMVLGEMDSGKSTFARYLYQRLSADGLTAFLDSDPGQSSLGPPTTQTLSLGRPGETDFPPRGPCWRRFVGSTSPARHLLPMLVGAARLVQQARKAGAGRVVMDTSGMVHAEGGGRELKLAKVELLRPAVVFAIQREDELEALLTPLQRSRRVRVVRLQPSPAVQRRSREQRRAHRRRRYMEHFAGAREIELDWTRLAVFPGPRFSLHRLAACEDRQGFTQALAIVTGFDRLQGRVRLLTPLQSLEAITALRLGDVRVDPHSFEDRQI